MFQAVLWDFGGVLTTSPFEAFNRFEQENGIPKDFIRQVNSVNPRTNAWARLESDQISTQEFDSAFLRETRAAGHPVRGSQVLPLLSGDLRPRMVEVLRKCRENLGLKLGCITNNVRAGTGSSVAASQHPAQEIQEVMSQFHVVVESSVEGVRKPDSRIYQIACERLGIVPTQAVYLDDLGINCKPARALGMHSIKVEDEAQAIKALGAALGCDF